MVVKSPSTGLLLKIVNIIIKHRVSYPFIFFHLDFEFLSQSSLHWQCDDSNDEVTKHQNNSVKYKKITCRIISSGALVIPAKDDSQCDHTWCYSDIVSYNGIL